MATCQGSKGYVSKSSKYVSNKTMLLVIFVCMLIVVCLYSFQLKDSNWYPSTLLKQVFRDPVDVKSHECQNNYFEDMLLVIVYNYPHYDSIPMLKSFYNDTFKHIIICGWKSHDGEDIMVVEIRAGGWYGYECAGTAMRRYPNYTGYLYVNDDMIVNWWTFYNLDKEKLWLGASIRGSHIFGKRPISREWPWWKDSAVPCEVSYSEIITRNYSSNGEYINTTKYVNAHLINGQGVKQCFNTWSDFFYVPKKFRDEFQRFSSVFFKNRVFLEAAVPTIMSFLELRDSYEKPYGLYLPDIYGYIDFSDGKSVWKHYNHNLSFIHPVKFEGTRAKLNRENFIHDVIPYSKKFTKC